MSTIVIRSTPSLNDLRSLREDSSQRSRVTFKRGRPDGSPDERDRAKGKLLRSSSCPPTPALRPAIAAASDAILLTTGNLVSAVPGVAPSVSSSATATVAASTAAVEAFPSRSADPANTLCAVVEASVSEARRTGTTLTVRKMFEDIIRARYTQYQPSNDFELFVMGSSDYSHLPPGLLSECLAQEWSYFVTMRDDDYEGAMAYIRRFLEKPAEVTGAKPLPGDPDVEIIPLPGSPYSLRLWPGSVVRREYCLDFVYVDDLDKPLNVPEGYRLSINIPMGPLPWLGIGVQDVHSVERNSSALIGTWPEGSEKYVLRDGLQCSMVYPTEDGPTAGRVRFDVPVRPRRGRNE